jgi:hypothetical protein
MAAKATRTVAIGVERERRGTGDMDGGAGQEGDEGRRIESSIRALCDRAFGPDVVSITGLDEINRGRGAFSDVWRAGLVWPDGPGIGRHPTDTRPGVARDDRPDAVVAKLPVGGPNGRAARASGAYRREALAYRELLPRSPIRHPRAFAVVEAGDACSLLLEDLTDRRQADQLAGLDADDAARVAEALAHFHRAWAGSDRLAGLAVRRNTLAGLDPEALVAGLDTLAERWGDVLGPDEHRVFADLVRARPGLVERFRTEEPTLCHGDPRADNLVFSPDDGRPILFDWQQLAIQFGEADLAWLAATSLTTEVRRDVEADLVALADGRPERYRLGLALPGLAVLLLAQRELPTERARRYVETTLRRISSALADNETAGLGLA